MFVVDPADGSKFWVRVREGKVENEGEELPYAGRVDIQVEAGPEREVKWLRLISAEVDHVSTFAGFLYKTFVILDYHPLEL